ncbi:hydroxyacylglutathione hydrolase [Halobacillus alkaliphilus]|uniref:Hydroxyacylglutathione hydrolase n=1 Tax=Halobacillus alkaliphilus TaxID=396056 RepID=A0A1I2JTY9_9BACI|nr:MBL fold metallo-hydrolase [Halobacillus alkaliphilus]SFF57503.1 hydroxyacylglutathione hydrolase [Halobacillus alkaliphilus]
MFLKYFYDKHLAQASYLIGCQATGEAAVIDPARNIEPYLLVAQEEGFSITRALETHIHADFVSGVTELARRTGAVIYHSSEGAENGGYTLDPYLPQQGLNHGDVVSVGNVKLRTLHTPGHTPEHISFELTDGAQAEQPMGVFTGDFVFVGDVGRPDLLEKAAGVKDSADKGARQMFHSLQQFKAYEDYVQIWPGHGAGSACGKALGAVPTSTVGYERRYNPAFQLTEEEEFVRFLLDGQPEPPAYFATMKRVNPSGMTPLAEVPGGVLMDLKGDSVAALAASASAMVIDTRSARDFAGGSIPGTINLPYPGPFAEWMGRLADGAVDLYMIAELNHVDEIRTILTSMGMDRIKGFFAPGVVKTATSLRSYTNSTPKEVEYEKKVKDLQILDVRYQDEWEAGHISDAIHIPLPELMEEAGRLSNDQPVAVHCASGIRSAIAASILLKHGYEVINMVGGFNRWQQEQLLTTSGSGKGVTEVS